MRKCCRICGADVGSADHDLCGRHSCQLAARERQPGSDDMRQPTRCVHCRVVGRGNPCPTCAALFADIDAPAVNGHLETETEDARRERFHAARVAAVNASFVRGRRCLLARSLGGFPGGLERAQPKL